MKDKISTNIYSNGINNRINTYNKREYWIDIERVFACLMVIFCHSPQTYTISSGQLLLGINNYFGMAWGPILFFMISGACVLGKDQQTIPFLKKRFSRILFPTLFWSIVYILLQCFIWKTIPSTEVTQMFLMIPFYFQYGDLWFMYTLASIYLMVPILSPWLSRCSKKELELYLTFWGITLLLPFLALFDDNVKQMSQINGVFFYLSGFLWVAVLGFYCRYFINSFKISFYSILICSLILISPLYIYIIKVSTGITITSSLTINSIATTMLAFIVIKNIRWSKKFQNIINIISHCSFGIYLSHMLFLHPFNIWIAQYNLHYAIQIPLTTLVVSLSSFSFAYILSKLPYGKYIIG